MGKGVFDRERQGVSCACDAASTGASPRASRVSRALSACNKISIALTGPGRENCDGATKAGGARKAPVASKQLAPERLSQGYISGVVGG